MKKKIWKKLKKEINKRKKQIKEKRKSAFNKFLDFFRMGTFIDSTQIKI